MTGKSPEDRLMLDGQAASICAVLESAGYARIEPEILQPADVFLDRSGEDIRLRTYVFTDPDGNELCLRPDLTIPTCRYHLEHVSDLKAETRYSYLGPAFRFQRNGARRLSSREFEQAGVEHFGMQDRERAEAQTVALAIKAVSAAGLKNYRVQVGDLGLFDALLAGIEMPDRWRDRLHHQFWRPEAFRNRLASLCEAGGSEHGLAGDLSGKDEGEALRVAKQYLLDKAIAFIGGRTIEEIAARLHEKAADRICEPLPTKTAKKIEAYLSIQGSPLGAFDQISELELPGPAFARALDLYARRFALLSQLGVDTSNFTFCAEFGRNLEYYTGHVFQIEAQGEQGPVQVVGGGRYDKLLCDLGASEPVPAVGFAIHTERLAAIIRKQADG